jgi:hypothetical protein
MQPVLDTPMTAHDLQQSFGGHVFRKVIAHDRPVGAAATVTPARGVGYVWPPCACRRGRSVVPQRRTKPL